MIEEAEVISEIQQEQEEEFKIAENGCYLGIKADTTKHSHDKTLAEALVQFFKTKNASSVVDLGAGLGKYTKEFRENNITTDCFDGNPDTVLLTEGRCSVLDLSKNIALPKYDWVMSLEVGEHLPKQFEDIFINNLINSSISGIIMSWAIPGQGGDGHINEQTNEYIKSKMAFLGFQNNLEEENILRESPTLFWFKNTVMVFEHI